VSGGACGGKGRRTDFEHVSSDDMFICDLALILWREVRAGQARGDEMECRSKLTALARRGEPKFTSPWDRTARHIQ